jgi:hypothetical protein
MRRATLLILVLVLGACALLAASASPAEAAARGGCPPQQNSRVFLRWLDPFFYSLAPGGTFEGGGWSGGSVVAGNEPWKVNATGDSYSLAISRGTAVSPAMCAGLTYPTLRFFAKGPLLGLLKVDVTYRTVLGLTATTPAGFVLGTGGWAPTLPMVYLGNVLSSLQLDGSNPMVTFRFTAAIGSWRIDDVYVDPLAPKCC